jgi:hypothetical protein
METIEQKRIIACVKRKSKKLVKTKKFVLKKYAQKINDLQLSNISDNHDNHLLCFLHKYYKLFNIYAITNLENLCIKFFYKDNTEIK